MLKTKSAYALYVEAKAVEARGKRFYGNTPVNSTNGQIRGGLDSLLVVGRAKSPRLTHANGRRTA